MALQFGALRDALLDAGASGDKARKATDEVASYENLKTDMSLLKWMVGGLYALAMPGAWLLIKIVFKTGAIG